MKLVKILISISFALMTLFPNLGLAVNSHFCQGTLVESSLSIGVHDLGCGMGDETSNNSDDGNEINSKPCCENSHYEVKLKDKFSAKFISLDISPVFIVAFAHVFVQPFIFLPEETVSTCVVYRPPIPREKDIQVLYQTFLI